MDNALQLIGMALKAGRVEIGEEPVGAAARAKKAKLILVAGDAADNTARRAAHYGEVGNVIWLVVPASKTQLGAAVGRSSCAMLAIMDVGLASALVAKLAEGDKEKYGEAAEQLALRADKALKRQQEKRQHEKNLLKRKQPWVPDKVDGKTGKPQTGGHGERPKKFKPKPKAPAKPPQGDKPWSKPKPGAPKPKTYGDKPKTYGDKPKTYGDKPKTYGDKPKTYGDKPKTWGGKPKSFGAKKPYQPGGHFKPKSPKP